MNTAAIGKRAEPVEAPAAIYNDEPTVKAAPEVEAANVEPESALV